MLNALMLMLAVLMLVGNVFASPSAPPFRMPTVKPPTFPDKTFNIKDYGAVSDGETLNSTAFADAIRACNEAGGGRVLVPAGKWLTGPIHLKSNVNLHVEKDAEILFSTDYSHYLPVVFTRWEGMECYNYSPLVYANSCTNIAVTGEGVLNGQGQAWWPLNAKKRVAAGWLYEAIQAGAPVQERVLGSEERPLRPSFLQPINCRNVLIEGITLRNGPMWTVHPVYCVNTTVRGIKVLTEGPNNDGIVPDSCRNMIIEDCFFTTGDDCIVMKSGLNEDGWRVNRPTENIIIRRCRTERGHGGVVIGSEMSGGVRNVFVQDCDFTGTQRGIRMKSMRGRGGLVENIHIDCLTMGRIQGEALTVNLFYGSSTIMPATNTPPKFRNISIRNVTCLGADQAIAFIGLPESPIENVVMENITLTATKGAHFADTSGITLKNVQVHAGEGPVVRLTQSRDITISDARCDPDTKLFLRVEGENSADIRVLDSDLTKAVEKTSLGEGVPVDAVSVK